MNGNSEDPLDHVERLLASVAERQEADFRDMRAMFKAQSERIGALTMNLELVRSRASRRFTTAPDEPRDGET